MTLFCRQSILDAVRAKINKQNEYKNTTIHFFILISLIKLIEVQCLFLLWWAPFPRQRILICMIWGQTHKRLVFLGSWMVDLVNCLLSISNTLASLLDCNLELCAEKGLLYPLLLLSWYFTIIVSTQLKHKSKPK